MKYILSKDFKKAMSRLGGKELKSVIAVIDEVERAASLSDISDCKKLVNFVNVYRIRIGSRRAFFTFHVEVIDGAVFFRFLVSRGQAYDKAMTSTLQRIDTEFE